MKKIVIIVVSAVLILIVTPLIICPLINDVALNIFAYQLFLCPLPLESEYIEQKQVCGKLNGCGNGMDFLACILIKSDVPINKLYKYYNNIEFRQAKPDSYKHTVEIEVLQAQSQELKSGYNTDIDFETIKDKKDLTGYYVIIIYDGGYPSDSDLRGH